MAAVDKDDITRLHDRIEGSEEKVLERIEALRDSLPCQEHGNEIARIGGYLNGKKGRHTPIPMLAGGGASNLPPGTMQILATPKNMALFLVIFAALLFGVLRGNEMLNGKPGGGGVPIVTVAPAGP